jgi:hypothetical protein
MTERAFDDDLHARTVLSLANGVTGVLEAATLGIHAIGRGLAAAEGLNRKHATKQAIFDMRGLLGVHRHLLRPTDNLVPVALVLAGVLPAELELPGRLVRVRVSARHERPRQS